MTAAARHDPLAGLRGRLAGLPGPLFGVFAGLMAFGTYSAMYAFRKPFAVASFADVAPVLVEYKIALVIAQLIGYATAKVIGIKVISELPASMRVLGIVAQVMAAEIALVAFALVPPPWNVAFLFLNGLALGMIWGMVFGFVEGRRQSDLIGAILCASFVLASGVVKSVGAWTMQHWHISQFWMPSVTGLLFVPLLLVCVTGLAALPPPNALDIAQRVERVPMDMTARRAFFGQFAPGLVALIAVYVLLTALRDLRDNFAAEIWAEVGLADKADIFALTELPISVVVLGALAALTVFRDNRVALVANFALVGFGLVLAGLGSLAFSAQVIGPVPWMIALGAGLYLAYTPFNGMLFDRLVGASGRLGTAGFLIYVADSSGYAGSVALVLLRNMVGLKLNWVRFLIDASLMMSVVGIVLMGWAGAYFTRKLAKQRT